MQSFLCFYLSVWSSSSLFPLFHYWSSSPKLLFSTPCQRHNLTAMSLSIPDLYSTFLYCCLLPDKKYHPVLSRTRSPPYLWSKHSKSPFILGRTIAWVLSNSFWVWSQLPSLHHLVLSNPDRTQQYECDHILTGGTCILSELPSWLNTHCHGYIWKMSELAQ